MQALKGSLVALVTPMLPNGDVDYQCLESLIDWHIEEGTNGIVSVGTTGESATLNIKEHIDVIRHTVNYANKRIPIIAGTGANSTQEAIDLTEESRIIGADYALLVTPYYNKPNQEGLLAHFSAIAENASIKQILYNVPARTACDLKPQTVKILSRYENIIGIKEAVDDMSRIEELIKISTDQNNNFIVFSGDDPTFTKALELGAHGVISVAANVIPKSIAKICSLSLEANFEDAILLDKKYKNLYRLLFVESNPIPVKWILTKMGLIKNSIRLPLIEFNGNFHEKTMSELKNLGLL